MRLLQAIDKVRELREEAQRDRQGYDPTGWSEKVATCKEETADAIEKTIEDRVGWRSPWASRPWSCTLPATFAGRIVDKHLENMAEELRKLEAE